MNHRSLILTFSFLLALVLAATPGCFNPDIQDGGFSCAKNNRCPEGFTCVPEGGSKVCRKDGGSATDAKAGDSAKPTDAKTEAPVDARPAEQGTDSKPDGPQPDAPPPTPICPGVDHLVASGVSTKADTFDLAIESTGRPHLIYVDSTGALKYVMLRPKSTPYTIKKSVTVAACIMETTDRFDVVYSDKSDGDKLRHQALDLSNPSFWSAEGKVWEGKTESVDLDTKGTYLFGAAQGSLASVETLYPFQIRPPGAKGETYPPCGAEVSTGTYGPVRVSSGQSNNFGHAAYLKKGTTEVFQIYARASACHQLQDIKVHDVSAPRPIAIATNYYNKLVIHHMAFVSAAGASGPLIYKPWPKGGGMPGPGEVAASDVVPTSMDIGLYKLNVPHVSYFTGGTSPGVYWSHRTGTASWKPTKISTGKGTESRLRIHTDSKATTVHIAYRVGTELRHACQVYKP